MFDDFHAFFSKKAQDEKPPELEEGTEPDEEGQSGEDSLQDLGFTDAEVNKDVSDSSFFFNPQEVDKGVSDEKTETIDYKVEDKEEQLIRQKTGIDILLEAHRVDWIIKAAYQSLYLFLKDAIKDSKSKELVYRIKFVDAPWSEGTVSIDTLSRFNVYYDSFEKALKNLEPSIKMVKWSPTFQGKDLFLTFEVSTK